MFITGASRGIGKDIALKCAKDGANIVIAAKTAEAHPKLPGTIYTAAQESKEAVCLVTGFFVRYNCGLQSHGINIKLDTIPNSKTILFCPRNNCGYF